MDIERLRQAVIDKRFILSANPDWREGRACGLSDDKTEQKANDALAIILENIAELVVAYLIGARHPVKSEDVQEAIEQLQSEYVDDLEGYPETCKKWNRNIDLAIAALQDYQPWVSVSERLPNDGVPVFVTYIGFSDGKPHSDGVARWSIEENGYNGGWLWELDRSEVTVEITHWKPLPEPPKGE